MMNASIIEMGQYMLEDSKKTLVSIFGFLGLGIFIDFVKYELVWV